MDGEGRNKQAQEMEDEFAKQYALLDRQVDMSSGALRSLSTLVLADGSGTSGGLPQIMRQPFSLFATPLPGPSPPLRVTESEGFSMEPPH